MKLCVYEAVCVSTHLISLMLIQVHLEPADVDLVHAEIVTETPPTCDSAAKQFVLCNESLFEHTVCCRCNTVSSVAEVE